MNDDKNLSTSINVLLEFLQNLLNNEKYQDDWNAITSTLKLIESLKTRMPTLETLESIDNSIKDLDCKYDDTFELVNVFVPIANYYEKQIHSEYVKSLREKNRRKRESKNGK